MLVNLLLMSSSNKILNVDSNERWDSPRFKLIFSRAPSSSSRLEGRVILFWCFIGVLQHTHVSFGGWRLQHIVNGLLTSWILNLYEFKQVSLDVFFFFFFFSFFSFIFCHLLCKQEL